MRRQHIIIGRNNSDIWPCRAQKFRFFKDGASGGRMGDIPFRQAFTPWPVPHLALARSKVARPALLGAFYNPSGYILDGRMNHKAGLANTWRFCPASNRALTGASISGFLAQRQIPPVSPRQE